MIRVCPHSDSKCRHGMRCPYTCATDAYDGHKNLCAAQSATTPPLATVSVGTKAPLGRSETESSLGGSGWRARLGWPGGNFSVFDPDPTDDHGAIYLVCPNGLMVNFSYDLTPGLDAVRVQWAANALNDALVANPIGAAERDVGRAVYERIGALMDGDGPELTYLAELVESVEEYGSYSGPTVPLSTQQAVSPPSLVDQDIHDVISDAIGDSMDMDWTYSDGAKAIMRAFEREGWAVVPLNTSPERVKKSAKNEHVDPLVDQEGVREALSIALWNVMHGHDGRLLTGDFYPGHDAIVDAILQALAVMSPRIELRNE